MLTEQLAILRTRATSPAGSLTPNEAEKLKSILRQAITEYGGTKIEAEDESATATFVSASAAIGCAVAMQQGVELANRHEGSAFDLRIGLSAGEVTHDESSYSGDCVDEAAQLCATCGTGQILAADVVRLLAGRRSRQEWGQARSVPLPGHPDPIDASEVVWSPLESIDAAPRIPLPGRLSYVAPHFVGRHQELQQIEDAERRVAANTMRELLFVSGEAGLGKTTLVGRATRAAFERGTAVLFGHCEEDLVAPYQLFAEALGHYVTHASEDDLRAHVAEYGSELVRLVPALAGRIPDLPPTKATDPDSERSLLFAAVVGMLAQASAQNPVLMMLDDIQWADKGSLLLLRHLAASDHPMRLFVLATFRDNETTELLGTLAALHRLPGVARLNLAGLGDAEVLECVQAMVGEKAQGVALEIAKAVHDETDGNPFFVTELLRHLSETGAISKDGVWSAAGGIDSLALPDSVREVVGARIARLDPACGKVLGMASIIGRDFDFDLLARASGVAEEPLITLLEQASEAGLIRELSSSGGRYHFTHALIQHVLYQDIGPARRIVAHRQVALALEALCNNRPGLRAGELARHWCHAPQSDDVPKAIRYAYEAGRSALAALAPADATSYFQSATALASEHGLSDQALEIDLAIGLGTAQRQSGDPAYRTTLLGAGDRAAKLGDTDRLVRAVLANDRGWHSTSGDSDSEKVAQLELALEQLPAGGADRALILGLLCSELAFGTTLEYRRALSQEALAIARALGDDAILVRIQNQMAFSLGVPSLLKVSLDWTADALTRAQRLGDPLQLYFAAMYRATTAVRACDIAEADRCFAIAGQLVHQLGLPLLRWEHTFHMSKRAQIAGELGEAERLAQEAALIGAECGQPDAQMFCGVQFAAISWMRGTMGMMYPMLQVMADANPGLPTIRASLAMAAAQAQELDVTAQILADFAATNYALPQDTTWLNGMTEYAAAAFVCEDRRYSQALYDILLPWAGQFSAAGGLTAEGPVALHLGALATVLGRYDEADGHLLASTDVCERHGIAFYAALTDLRRGQLLLKRDREGDRELARGLLHKAAEVAATRGYGEVERDASALLAAMETPQPVQL
jgi:AAA ATPase domain